MSVYELADNRGDIYLHKSSNSSTSSSNDNILKLNAIYFEQNVYI